MNGKGKAQSDTVKKGKGKASNGKSCTDQRGKGINEIRKIIF